MRRADQLPEILQRWFTITADVGEAESDDRICRLVVNGRPGTWIVQALPGGPHHALLPRSRGSAWSSLPIAAVQGILDSVTGADSGAGARLVRPAIDELEAVAQVRRGEAAAAFLLPRPRVGTLLTVAEQSDLLPAKSTWFEPKAPAGLVINDLRL
jgi:hypothetical protein